MALEYRMPARDAAAMRRAITKERAYISFRSCPVGRLVLGP
jgi:hypothetical protein